QSSAADGSVPTTPSVPHFYALARQLDDIINRETLEARFRRHQTMREIVLERSANYAKLAADPDHASNTVSALTPLTRKPDEIRDAMKKRGFTLGGGYGQWKDTTFRIGHMGDISVEDLNAMLDVLDEVVTS